MPISDRIADKTRAGRRKTAPALFLSLMALLPACQMALPTAGSGSALETATLDAGDVTIRGPAGFCIDAKSLRPRGEKQFALLAQCDILKSGEIEGVSTLSFLTVTAVRSSPNPTLPTAAQLAEAFGPARILRQTNRDGARLVQLSDGGQRASVNAIPVHWRGVMQIPGHTIGLAAYSTEGGAASDLNGRDLLLQLVSNIRRDSTGTATGDSLSVQKPTN